MTGNTVLQTDRRIDIRHLDKCKNGHSLVSMKTAGENSNGTYKVFARCPTCAEIRTFTRRNMRH